MAAYCNAADVRAMLKDDLINSLLGDQYIRDEEEREQRLLPLIEAAAEDAQAEIDGYLAKRYAVPLTRVPKVISKYAKDIAVWGLRRTGNRTTLSGTNLLSSSCSLRRQGQ